MATDIPDIFKSLFWYERGDLNPHAPFRATDFKSGVSTDSTTLA